MRASIWSLIRNLFESKIQLRRCIEAERYRVWRTSKGGSWQSARLRVPLLNRRYLSK